MTNIKSSKRIGFHYKLASKDLETRAINYWKANRIWIIGALFSFPIIIFSLPFLIAAIAADSNHVLQIPTIIIISLTASSVSYIFSETTRLHFHNQNMRPLALPWHHWFLVKSIYYAKLYSPLFLVNGIAILSLHIKLPLQESLKPTGLILANMVCIIVISDLTARYQAKWVTGFLLVAMFNLLIFNEKFTAFILISATIFITLTLTNNFIKNWRINFLVREGLVSTALATFIWLFLLINKDSHQVTIATIFLIIMIFHEANQAKAALNQQRANFIFMPHGEAVLQKITRQAVYFYAIVAMLVASTDVVWNDLALTNTIIIGSSLTLGLISLLFAANHMLFLQGILILLYLVASLS